MTRAVSFVLFLVAFGVGLLFFLLGGGRRGPGLEPERDVRPARESASPVNTRARDPLDEPGLVRAPVAESDEPAQSETAKDAASSAAAWSACYEGGDEAQVRACLRAWLLEEDPDPEALAALICPGGAWREGMELFLQEASLAWAPVSAASRFHELNELCPGVDEVWPRVFDHACANDPEWCRLFGSTLVPEDLFGESGLGFIEMAYRAARTGNEGMVSLLEEGARGEWGGDAEQVALALAKAWSLRSLPADRLSLLREVAASPTFQGRDFEVDALVGWALNRDGIPPDAMPTIEFVRGLLNDARFGARAAEHLLVLDEWGAMPDRFHLEHRESLLDLARSLVGR